MAKGEITQRFIQDLNNTFNPQAAPPPATISKPPDFVAMRRRAALIGMKLPTAKLLGLK